MKLPTPPLLLITDRHQARAPLERILAAAFAAGCRWASIREKDLGVAAQIALAHRLLPLARQHGATLTLHGDPQIAAKAGVDGVHLSAGADAGAARALLGQNALIGISVHSADDTVALGADVLDYVVAGPVFETQSKPGYGPFLGPAGIRAICRATVLPVIAIGGIPVAAMAGMLQAGAAGVAIMGGIMRAADPGDQVRRFVAAMSPGRATAKPER